MQDSTDTSSSLENKNFPYLDSDGSFRNDDPRNVTDHVELEDGQWHMITLTTNPDDKGYRLYIDGELAGVTPKSKGLKLHALKFLFSIPASILLVVSVCHRMNSQCRLASFLWGI